MKKMILALGSALMLLATTVQAEETMSFGVKGGGSFFMPTVKEKSGSTDLEGKLNMFVGGGLFFDYMVMDNLSVGVEVGYSRKGFSLDKKDAKFLGKATADQEGAYIDALDITLIPFNFFPMGEEEGLSVYLGAKGYLALSEKLLKGTKAKEKVLNTYNIGATAGVEYEIAETGFFVGASYEFFFFDTFNSNDAGKAYKETLVGKDNKDKTFYTQGAQAFVGFDFASLLD